MSSFEPPTHMKESTMPRPQIGFQGLRGAYSELAILQYFGKEVLGRVKPLPSFEQVFQEISTSKISDALLPFENSLAGAIYENFDHLARFPVTIVGETILRIQHCLVAPPGTTLSGIKVVMSHPQALAQCSDFLRDKNFLIQSFFDTAGAAEHLAKNPTPHLAAIASEQAARLYGLKILTKNIADRGENYTRFLHLKKHPKTARKDSSSAPKHPGRTLSLLLLHSGEGFARIGPLCGILQSLGLELVHCEARPTKEAAWTYHYFLEIAAGPEHPGWKTALMTLGAMTKSLKVLGSYESTR